MKISNSPNGYTLDDTAWQRIIRDKPEVALSTVVCVLEQHNESGRKTLVPKQYPKIGNLTAPKHIKFSLRAGVAELQEEIERRDLVVTGQGILQV